MSDDSDLLPIHENTFTDHDEENTGNEALIYHNRVFAISYTTNFLIFILIFLTIIFPWWISRNDSANTIHYLISERISTASKAFANATENLMRKYEITGTQLKDLSYDPLLARCSANGTLNFIRYAQTMNSVLNPKPYRFYLCHNQTASCQLELDQTDSLKFKIYMLLSFNQTHDQLKVFTEENDLSPGHFKPEDNNQGTILQYVSTSKSTLTFTSNPDFFEVPYWTSAIPYFGNLSESRTLTFLYPHKDNPEPYSTTLSGVAILNNEVFNFLNNIPSSSQVSWIILDENYNILIDKELGAINPISISNNIPTFPSIENSQNNIWREASEYIYNLKDETPVLINMNDIQYYLVERQINTYDERLAFHIFMMICIDELSNEVFKPSNFLVLVVTHLTGLAIFLEWFFNQRTKKRRDKKLSLVYREKKANESSANETSNVENNIFDNANIERNSENADPTMNLKPPFFNTGTIGKSILELRKLELFYPEEIMMNKIVSSAVNCFAKTRNRLFSITSVSENCKNCELCKYLNPEPFKILNFNSEDQFISSQKQHQSYLLFQQKFQRIRLNHNVKVEDENIFHPYKYMNLRSDQVILQDLLDENYQEDSETVNSSNASFSNLKYSSNSYYGGQDENSFMTWEVLTFNNISKSYFEENNDQTNPIIDIDETIKIRRKIAFKFIELIREKKLIFNDIDPDQLIEFALFFVDYFMKNPYKTYENLKTIDYLFSVDFYAWINNKLDIFSLILCIFARDIETITDEEAILFINNEKSKLINNGTENNNNNNDNDNTFADENANNGNNFYFNNLKHHFDISEMPIFDISTDMLCTNFSNDSESSFSSDEDSHQIEKKRNNVITQSDVFKFSSKEDPEENLNNNNVDQPKNSIFTLNDQYSKRMRQIEILRYCFEKYIPFNQHRFNHVYISQRINRIFESCSITNHFEIFSEFENRALSPEFSVINNSEDINIFMNVIFSFTEYSRYWCDTEDFNNVFDEFNHQNFSDDELMNDKFVWSFHDEILSRVVKPMFQLLSIFCPLEDMDEKIRNISRLIQMKMDGKSIAEFTSLFQGVQDANENSSSYTTTHKEDTNSNSNEDYSINLDHQSSRSKKDSKNLSSNQRAQISFILNSNDDEDIFIDDGGGEDVDGD